MAIDESKPHNGRIEDWTRVPCDHGAGFFVVGRFVDHYRLAGLEGHTSWAVALEGDQLETRNSRYTLVGPGW